MIAVCWTICLLSLAALLVCNLVPAWCPAHNVVAAAALILIGAIWIVYRVSGRASKPDMVKAVLLALAFFFWAANQLLTGNVAVYCNDAAIALFVLDVLLQLKK